jgi:hypothetical protein
VLGTRAPKKSGIGDPLVKNLLADAEFLNNGFVALGIVSLQIIQQATALADQHEQAASGGMVLFVRLEMLRQLTDALAQKRNLDFRTARVGLVRTVRVDYGLLSLSG